MQQKTNFHSKSTGALRTNIGFIDENTEEQTLNTETSVLQPTKTEIKRDIQILTLDRNNEKENHLTASEHNETRSF